MKETLLFLSTGGLNRLKTVNQIGGTLTVMGKHKIESFKGQISFSRRNNFLQSGLIVKISDASVTKLKQRFQARKYKIEQMGPEGTPEEDLFILREIEN